MIIQLLELSGLLLEVQRVHVLLELLAEVAEWVHLSELLVQLADLLQVLYLLVFVVGEVQLIRRAGVVDLLRQFLQSFTGRLIGPSHLSEALAIVFLHLFS